jgi:hypothetical protein
MKKQLILTGITIFVAVTAFAQRQPPQSIPLPLHDIVKPKPNVKSYTLATDLVGRWKGARIIQNVGSATVDSLWMEFKANGTVSFKHQQFELNGPQSGTYTISRSVLKINIEKLPFTHSFDGGMNVANGIITGTCTEVRAEDNTQPAYYTAGTFSGSFNLKKY